MARSREVSSPFEPNGKSEDRIRTALNDYLDGISKLDLVSEVFWGVPRVEDRAYVVNVFKEDVDLASPKDPKYALLTAHGGQLERKLAEDVLVRVLYLNPSLKQDFLQTSEKRQLIFQPLASF